MRSRKALLVAGALAGFACGKIEDVLPNEAGAGDGAHDAATLEGGADGGHDVDVVAVDTSRPKPDGGPVPGAACADAATPCLLPPATCLDDHWLRSYTNGRCVDGGCAFDFYDMLCDPSPVPPD